MTLDEILDNIESLDIDDGILLQSLYTVWEGWRSTLSG